MLLRPSIELCTGRENGQRRLWHKNPGLLGMKVSLAEEDTAVVPEEEDLGEETRGRSATTVVKSVTSLVRAGHLEVELRGKDLIEEMGTALAPPLKVTTFLASTIQVFATRHVLVNHESVRYQVE